MRLYTQRDAIKDGFEEFWSIYRYRPALDLVPWRKDGTTFGYMFIEVSRLNPDTCTKEDLQTAIRDDGDSGGWGEILCSGCNEFVDVAVELCEDFVCYSCLRDAFAILRRPY